MSIRKTLFSESFQSKSKANTVLSQSLTKELVQYKAIEKLKGEVPKFTGSDVIPFLDVTGE